MIVAVPELWGEQIDWLEGVQYAIAVPGPHRCQRVKLQLANVVCTICMHSTDAYPPLL